MQLTGGERQFEAAKKKLLENLVKSLYDQFYVGKTEDEAKVLKASCISNLKLWPEDLDDDPGYKETFKLKCCCFPFQFHLLILFICILFQLLFPSTQNM